MRVRHGFTLREMLIAVTAISVGFALLMPVIEAAREAARRMSCRNNFRQIGLAVHNYHSTYRQCPSAMFGTESNEHRLNGLVALTPFIEASPAWDRVSNPSTYNGKHYPSMGPVPWDTNYEPWCEGMRTFRCPSDPGRGPKLARCNYAFSVGDKVSDLYSGKGPNDARGMFAPGIVLTFADVVDGLSNTVMMTEIGTERSHRLAGQYSVGHPPSLAQNPADCLKVADSARPLFYDSSVPLSKLGRGGAFADGAGGYGLVQTILPPNSPSCAIGELDPADGLFSAGSYHEGGCHVLIGDGAVIFISDTIENGDLSIATPITVGDKDGKLIRSPYGLWGALGTRASEEVVEEQICQ